MNPWEIRALQYEESTCTPDGGISTLEEQKVPWTRLQTSRSDPIIYPGVYSTSGFDVMGVLLQVVGRPNPQIDLGPIDASCPLVMCDLKQADSPIVYASDAFVDMLGYSRPEVLGRNCRFLQGPEGNVRARSVRQHVNKDAIRYMRRAVERNCEVQVEVVNFKKGGRRFTNILAIVPVCYQDSDFNYSVGFMCEKEDRT